MGMGCPVSSRGLGFRGVGSSCHKPPCADAACHHWPRALTGALVSGHPLGRGAGVLDFSDSPHPPPATLSPARSDRTSAPLWMVRQDGPPAPSWPHPIPGRSSPCWQQNDVTPENNGLFTVQSRRGLVDKGWAQSRWLWARPGEQGRTEAWLPPPSPKKSRMRSPSVERTESLNKNKIYL